MIIQFHVKKVNEFVTHILYKYMLSVVCSVNM